MAFSICLLLPFWAMGLPETILGWVINTLICCVWYVHVNLDVASCSKTLFLKNRILSSNTSYPIRGSRPCSWGLYTT